MRLNKRGIAPLVVVFQVIFITTGIVCAWHIPARSKARAEQRATQKAIEASATIENTVNAGK